MSVLPQTLLALVSSHFVFLSLLTTWHNTFGFVRQLADGFRNYFILNLSGRSLLWLARLDPYLIVSLFQTAGAAYPYCLCS